MRIRTPSHFVDRLGDEFSWRNKELLDYRVATRTTNLVTQKILLRAGVPLAYAHWEGFVKCSTELLLNFISHQGLRNGDLSDSYFTHSVKTHVAKLVDSSRAVAVNDAACFVRDASDKTADIRHKNYVDTNSNLSSDMFEQIARSMGIDTRAYQHIYPYIDESIVSTRNRIAHGEHLQLSPADFHALIDRVSDLNRMYKIDLENIVTLELFKRG